MEYEYNSGVKEIYNDKQWTLHKVFYSREEIFIKLEHIISKVRLSLSVEILVKIADGFGFKLWMTFEKNEWSGILLKEEFKL